MTTEKTEEKTVETTTPSAEDKTAELETLRQTLAERESALAEATERARRHEQAATRNANRLQEQQRRTDEIRAVKSDIGVIKEAIKLLYQNTEEETAPRRPSFQELEERLKPKPDPQESQYSEDFIEKAQEAEALAKAGGLDMAKSKELREARNAFRDGDADDGLELVKQVVEAKRQPPKTEVKAVTKEEPKKLTESEEEEIARKYMEKKGLLVTDLNQPSSVSTTDAEIERRYAEGEMSTADYDSYLNKRKT